MKVGELIETLGDFDPEMEVRIAEQPSWPMEHYIGQVVIAGPEDDEEDDEDQKLPQVVYLAEGSHIGYLPGFASRVLGWR